MGLYGVDLARATVTTTEAAGVVQATITTPRRLLHVKSVIGCNTAGTDETYQTLLAFLTTGAPTGGTGVTPAPLQGNPASLCDATEGAITVDPTQGTDIDRVNHHRRTTVILASDPGKEPISSAADNAGFGVFTPIAPTLTAGITSSMHVIEE